MLNETPQPLYYTSVEGGTWKPWPEDIELIGENHLAQRAEKCVQMNGLFVHSLAFDKLSVYADFKITYRRWDCVNGWTHKGE